MAKDRKAKGRKRIQARRNARARREDRDARERATRTDDERRRMMGDIDEKSPLVPRPGEFSKLRRRGS